MNKIEYRGKTVVDFDALADKYTKAETDTLLSKKVGSDTVTEIKLVTEYPEEQEEGVLYIKLES